MLNIALQPHQNVYWSAKCSRTVDLTECGMWALKLYARPLNCSQVHSDTEVTLATPMQSRAVKQVIPRHHSVKLVKP
jgi:hypothetical protein